MAFAEEMERTSQRRHASPKQVCRMIFLGVKPAEARSMNFKQAQVWLEQKEIKGEKE